MLKKDKYPSKCSACCPHLPNSSHQQRSSQIHMLEVEHGKDDRRGEFAPRECSSYFLSK